MIPSVYYKSDHGISRDDIDPDALKVLHRLSSHGFQARLVGGGVRDILLGKTPKDFDIATDARPNEIRRVFGNSRVIGRRFKLTHVYFSGGKIIEVATFRAPEDSTPADGDSEEILSLQHDNNFGTEETDALRRDITVNGLFYDAESETVIDYVNGMNDLRNEIVRIIGDPARRYIEDPVRMLRVVRHAVRAGFMIEAETWEALEQEREIIKICAPMRLYEELKKDLESGYSLPIFRLLHQAGLLNLLVPQIKENDLDPGMPLAEVLKNLDTLLDSQENTIFSVFWSGLILSLLTPADMTSGGTIANLEAIEELVESGFQTNLGIPRRMRENTISILSLWFKTIESLESPLTAEILKRQFSRKEARYADQVIMLHRLLPTLPEDRGIYQRLIEIRRLSR